MNEFDDLLKALDESTMVTIADKEGVLLYVNKLFCDISKYSKDELVGKKPHELLKSNHHSEEFYQNIWNTIMSGRAWKGDVVNKAKDGSLFWTLTTIMPFLDGDGKPHKFIAIRKDITDRVKTEEKLRISLHENETKNIIIQDQINELEKMDHLKEEFASMVTHELKTPLVPIKGYCKMLMDPSMFGELNEEQKDAVVEISENADRLERLIADVLDAQKLDMKKMAFKKEPFDVSEMIKTIEKDMIVITKEKNIQFVTTYSSEKLFMTSDKGRIMQVIENLIKNAIDFVSSKDGRIEFGVKKLDNEILFYVKDNGIGIDKAKQKHLFKKFYQVDTSASRKHGGTGLGLAICKGIVEGLGGNIWVESDAGKGATFYLTLRVNKL